jgi:PiT family inorganic phosphate transporter
MGIIAGMLYTVPQFKHLVSDPVTGALMIPLWIVLMAHAAIALGTLSGGWRIIHTMGSKITKLVPMGGFAAETAGAITLFASTALGVPVSTTLSSPAPSSASGLSGAGGRCGGESQARSYGRGC